MLYSGKVRKLYFSKPIEILWIKKYMMTATLKKCFLYFLIAIVLT